MSLIIKYVTNDKLTQSKGPSCPWSSHSWIYNYLCNQSLSPLMMWYSLSVTCDRSVVLSGSSGFLHQYNWPLRYNWNIVESGVRHHKKNQRNATLLFGHEYININIFLFKFNILINKRNVTRVWCSNVFT